jgi:hypothetical protein
MAVMRCTAATSWLCMCAVPWRQCSSPAALRAAAGNGTPNCSWLCGAVPGWRVGCKVHVNSHSFFVSVCFGLVGTQTKLGSKAVLVSHVQGAPPHQQRAAVAACMWSRVCHTRLAHKDGAEHDQCVEEPASSSTAAA